MTPDAVIGLVKPPSITVDTSHALNESEETSFYGVEDSVKSALALGEQTLGRHVGHDQTMRGSNWSVSNILMLAR